MTRLDFGRGIKSGFDGGDILQRFHGGIDEPDSLDVLYPVAAAASGWRPVYGDANRIGVTWVAGI